MPRILLALLLSAGVASAGTVAERPVTSPAEAPTASTTTTKAASSKSTSKAKATAKAKTTSKAKAKAKAKALAKKKKRKSKRSTSRKSEVSRIPTPSSLRHLDNMPHGYAWPPTEQMIAAEKACEAKLDEVGIVWKPASSEGRIVDAMTVTGEDGTMTLGGITYRSAWRKGPHKLDCQLALALHELGPELAGLGVREIKFGSIYRWTNVRVNGQTKNILSRHALGIAMDINSFIDASGREAVVEKDYPKNDPLLLAVEERVAASGKFRVLLTPKNDPISHHDHFHLEVAVDYTRVDHAALAPGP